MPYSRGRIVHDADAHIMETPTWLRDHAEAAYRDRLAVLRYPGGNELRQTGDPAEQQRDLDAAFERLGPGTPRPSTGPTRRPRSWRARTSPPPGRSSPRTAPGRSTCSGSRSQLVFNTFHNGRLHDMEHGDDVDLAYAAARAHNRGMLEFCSVDPRLLPTCYVPLVDLERARRRRTDAIGRARRPCWWRRAARRRYSPEPPRPLRRLGPGPGGRHPRRVPRRRDRDLIDPNYFVNGLPGPARLPRRRGELPLGRLHGHPGPSGPDPGHPDLRRGARGVPRAAHRGDRAGRHLGAVVAAPDGVRLRGLPPPRGAAAGAVAAPDRLRAPPGPLHPVPDRGRRLDRRGGGADLVHVLVRLPPRRGRPQAARALRGVAGRRRRGCAPAVLLRQLPVPDGQRRDAHWRPDDRVGRRGDSDGVGDGRRRAWSSRASRGSATRSPHNFDDGPRGGRRRSACTSTAARSSTSAAAPSTARNPALRADTLQLVFSSTKGATAVCANLLAQRGRLDLDAPVATYWPEFAQAGKEDLPVRFLLSHQAGLPAVDATLTPRRCGPGTRSSTRSPPRSRSGSPGRRTATTPSTYGYLVGEVVRRVTGRSLGTFFAEEVAGPLGSSSTSGCPRSSSPGSRPSWPRPIGRGRRRAPRRTTRRPCWPAPSTWAAPSADRDWMNDRAWHAAEVPAANGITNAASLSRLYAGLIGTVEGGPPEPLLTPDQVERARTLLTFGPTWSSPRSACRWSRRSASGFWRCGPRCPFGGEGSFGHGGAGGSYGFADPEHGLAVGYVMNKMSAELRRPPPARAAPGGLRRHRRRAAKYF